MTNSAVQAQMPTRPLVDAVFGDMWPDQQLQGRPGLVAGAFLVGLCAAVVVPYRDLGLGTTLVLLAIQVIVLVAAGRRRLSPDRLLAASLCIPLAATPAALDATWIVTLCVLAAFGIGAAGLTRACSVNGLLASTAAVPLAGIRGLPWLGRSLRVPGRPAQWWPMVRTAVLSVALVLVFGALFASADALFARWMEVLIPDLTVDYLLVRGFVLVVVIGVTLAGVYVVLNPPQVDRLALPTGRAVRRFEWLAPVSLVVMTFLVFIAAQLTAMFGGHDHVRRTTGLTYAAYVHQGFGQLTVVTLLTLAVIAATVRHASQATSGDRALLRGMLTLLCLLTLVVVASALFRMHVYEEAYGFTRLRLLVSAFEAWLGVVVVLVLVAGVQLRGKWVPRAALLLGGTMLLGLAALNPDGYIAERNIERFQETGRIDLSYLAGLSADAVPAYDALPERLRACLLADHETAEDDWLEWNLGRHRAADALSRDVVGHVETCP